MRVLTIRESTWVNGTPERVAAVLTDLESWPDWSPLVLEADWLGSSEGWRAGERLRIRVPAGLRTRGNDRGVPASRLAQRPRSRPQGVGVARDRRSWLRVLLGRGGSRWVTARVLESPPLCLRWRYSWLGLPAVGRLLLERDGIGVRVCFEFEFRAWAAYVVCRPWIARGLGRFQRQFLGHLRTEVERVKPAVV